MKESFYLENNTSLEYAIYRVKRAKEECEIAELLLREKKLLAANNRAYYSIFYTIRAVLATEGKDFKRHKDVLAYFNQKYVKTEIFPRPLGRRVILASKIREDSDYDEEYEPSMETTQEQIQTAKELIALVEKYIENKKQRTD